MNYKMICGFSNQPVEMTTKLKSRGLRGVYLYLRIVEPAGDFQRNTNVWEYISRPPCGISVHGNEEVLPLHLFGFA